MAPRLDEKGITVSAVPARWPRINRLVRTLGLDRNPLRRSTDRAVAWLRLAIVAAFLAVAPMAALVAGHWMYHAATSEARTQAAARHSVRRSCYSRRRRPSSHGRNPLGRSGLGSRPVADPWRPPHTAQVLASAGLRAGSLVTVWLNAAGKVTAPPLQPAQITDRTVAVAAAAPVVLALSLLIALLLAQRTADRRRLAAWDAAWLTVGPDWTRLGP